MLKIINNGKYSTYSKWNKSVNSFIEGIMEVQIINLDKNT